MTSPFWKEFPTPIIGLAPMDGYSDSAFRRTCKEVNPSILTYTEFTSADGIHHGSDKLKKKLKFHDSEKPVLAQIFGKNEDTFITAAKVCEEMGFTGIDINMGCPSKKVVKSEHGVALRKNPDLAYKLIEAVANATSLPVSVKTRLGWDKKDSGLTEFAIGAQNAGAQMICVHARTYTEPYGVPPNYEPLYEMKEAVDIPVIGNGGVNSIKEGLDYLGNLDGFLIGQATFGNPWVFDPTGNELTFTEKAPLILKHANWLIELKGERVGTREIRKHLVKYVQGFKGAKEFRSKLVKVETFDQIEAYIQEIIELNPIGIRA